MGLKTAIRSEQCVLDILPTDYTRSVVHRMKREGMPILELEEFAPSIFSDIRKKYEISPKNLLASWILPPSMLQLQSVKVEGEKEYAQFFVSKDKKYIVKFLSKAERQQIFGIIYQVR
jgi:hypothetical protein